MEEEEEEQEEEKTKAGEASSHVASEELENKSSRISLKSES